MIQFVSLERVRLRIRSSRKNLKLVDEEPTPVMPDEMENLVKELPRDSEIVTLFKRMKHDCKT